MWEKLRNIRLSVQVTIAVISVLSVFVILFTMMFKEIPQANKDVFVTSFTSISSFLVGGVSGWLYTRNKTNSSDENKGS